MAQSYRFGQVEVRPAERQLLVDGRPAAVGARAFDVLLALIDRRDRVVSKDELFDIVWPGLVVEENNLHVQVSALRKILGPHSVTTVPGRGFRFTLPVDHADAGPSGAALPRKNNLPAQLNSFIGREREMGELKKLLGTARLVTLTSVGGTGKTRLSLQVAAELTGDYPDGVWFVELAPIADESRVPQAVASVLEVKEEAGRPVAEALVKYARDRRMLIILDNCEHVLSACAELAKQLMQAGPHVKILASSREHLHVAGESIYPVPALALPDPHRAVAIEELRQCEAVRLFVDRAVAAQPSFQVTPQNALAVAQICHRLDGIPLAIELAAARVRALSAEQIAVRIDDCFRLLTGGDHTALPRQKTLRASIDWSYDLLAIPERILLQRLAVFAGGWTLEAAEAVGAGGDVEPSAVLDLLTHLVEKSLVVLDSQGERYRLLETVRQYAQELLHASGEEGGARARHLAFYLALAERAHPQLFAADQGAWLSRLDPERENFLSAHAWCDHAEDGAELGLRLASSIKHYWFNRGPLSLGYRMTVQALSRAGAQARSRTRGWALFVAGQFAYFMGRYGESRRYLQESLAIARDIADKAAIAAALQPLGLACLAEGDSESARAHLEEALALVRGLGDKRNTAAALNALAQLHRAKGNLDEAEPLYENVLALAREVGDHETIAVALLNLAMTCIGRGTRGGAGTMLLQALDIVDQIGSRRSGQSVLEVTAGLAASYAEWESAARFYGAAEAQRAQSSLRRAAPDEAFLKPLIEEARAALGEPAFDSAEAQGRASSYEEMIRQARAWLKQLDASC